MASWSSTAGPIQTKRVEKLLSKLRTLSTSKYTKHGTIGVDEYTVSTVTFGLGRTQSPAPETLAILDILKAVGEEYDYSLTRENLAAVESSLHAAIDRAQALVPVIDERITPEEKAAQVVDQEVTRAAFEIEQAQKNRALDAAWAPILAKAGSADALIVASLKEDTSHPQSDYLGNKTVRRVAIGARHGRREDFQQIRQAAETFLRSIGEESKIRNLETRRDKFSRGSGNYISDHGYDGGGSGWRFDTVALPLSSYAKSNLCEDGFPERNRPQLSSRSEL